MKRTSMARKPNQFWKTDLVLTLSKSGKVEVTFVKN